MAGLCTRRNGSQFITFWRDGQRFMIHLGQTAKAKTILSHVEELISAAAGNATVKPATAAWLKGIDDELASKLFKVGLIEPRQRPESTDMKLKAFIDSYIEARTDLKWRSRNNLEQARDWIVKFFKAERRIDTITEGDAIDEFRPWLKSKLSDNTARMHCRRAKEFFAAAVRKKLITENPFAKMDGCYVKENRARDYTVSRDEAYKVLDACPGTQWKLLFALARFGGLRCPSEPRLLKWSDIDFAKGRMTVHSPKTEHHDGKDKRVVPVFPELLPYLQDAKLVAEPKAEYVITLPSLRRDSYANIGSQMARYVKRAGLKPWPKLFQNCRATRETELAAEHPIHVVCEWIGNSKAVAAKHYLRVTDLDFDKAQLNRQLAESQQGQEKSDVDEKLLAEIVRKCLENGKIGQFLATVGNCRKSQVLPPTGFEPVLPD